MSELRVDLAINTCEIQTELRCYPAPAISFDRGLFKIEGDIRISSSVARTGTKVADHAEKLIRLHQ
jgi:hypothetical protein